MVSYDVIKKVMGAIKGMKKIGIGLTIKYRYNAERICMVSVFYLNIT